MSATAPSPRATRCAPAPPAAGTFPPQRPPLRLDSHGYSPAALHLLAEAAGQLKSFADASFAAHLAGLDISPRHLGRLVHEIGDEMAKRPDPKGDQPRRPRQPAR